MAYKVTHNLENYWIGLGCSILKELSTSKSAFVVWLHWVVYTSCEVRLFSPFSDEAMLPSTLKTVGSLTGPNQQSSCCYSFQVLDFFLIHPLLPILLKLTPVYLRPPSLVPLPVRGGLPNPLSPQTSLEEAKARDIKEYVQVQTTNRVTEPLSQSMRALVWMKECVNGSRDWAHL